MRVALVAAIAAVLAPSAIAQDPFLKGDALAADMARNCADGCVTLNREEAANLSRALSNMVEQARQEGYQAGKLSCRNAT